MSCQNTHQSTKLQRELVHRTVNGLEDRPSAQHLTWQSDDISPVVLKATLKDCRSCQL
jgi:hypothetical protein